MKPLFVLNLLLLTVVVCVLFQQGLPDTGQWRIWLVYALWAAFPIVNMIVLLILQLRRRSRTPDLTAQVIDSFLEGSDAAPEPAEGVDTCGD